MGLTSGFTKVLWTGVLSLGVSFLMLVSAAPLNAAVESDATKAQVSQADAVEYLSLASKVTHEPQAPVSAQVPAPAPAPNPVLLAASDVAAAEQATSNAPAVALATDTPAATVNPGSPIAPNAASPSSTAENMAASSGAASTPAATSTSSAASTLDKNATAQQAYEVNIHLPKKLRMHHAPVAQGKNVRVIIDVSHTKCQEILDKPNALPFLIAWTDGYLSGVTLNTWTDDDYIKDMSKGVMQYCQQYPEALYWDYIKAHYNVQGVVQQ